MDLLMGLFAVVLLSIAVAVPEFRLAAVFGLAAMVIVDALLSWISRLPRE
jgi:hypothetical protein